MSKNSKDKEINKGLKLLAKTSIIVFIGIFLSKLFTYFYRIVVARYFGPEVYGLFSLAIMIVGWSVAFFGFGLNEGVLRFTSIYRGKNQADKIKYIFRRASKIFFITGIFASLILFIFADYISLNFFNNENLSIFLKIFSILVPLYLFSGMFLSILKSFEKTSWYSFIDNVLQNLVKLILLGLFIFWGLKSFSIILSYALGIFSMLIASFLVCKYTLPEIFKKYKLDKKTKLKIDKKVFSYSWPVMFIAIIYGFLFWIDSIFLGYFKGATEVGFYNAAIPIISLLWIVPNLFIPLFFPLITKDFAKKKFEVIRELTKQIGKWILILNLPIFLILILFPGAVINLLFGPSYIFAENALRFLSIGALFFSMGLISSQILSMMGKTKLILIDTIFVAILNVVLNFFLIPMPKILFLDNSLGLIGAAVATTISYTLFSLILIFQARQHFSVIPLRKKSFRILIVAIIPVLVLIWIKQFTSITLLSLLFQGSFFILLYFLLIFLTKCLDKNDIMILKTIKKRLPEKYLS